MYIIWLATKTKLKEDQFFWIIPQRNMGFSFLHEEDKVEGFPFIYFLPKHGRNYIYVYQSKTGKYTHHKMQQSNNANKSDVIWNQEIKQSKPGNAKNNHKCTNDSKDIENLSIYKTIQKLSNTYKHTHSVNRRNQDTNNLNLKKKMLESVFIDKTLFN